MIDEDPEAKNLLAVNKIAGKNGMLSYLTQRMSSWKKIKKIVAIMSQYNQKLLKIIRQKRQYHNFEDHTSEESYQDISMLHKAETEIMKICQASNFRKETETINAGNSVRSSSSIHQVLDLFLNKVGILRVGGRLVKSNLGHELKHSDFFPKYCTIS